MGSGSNVAKIAVPVVASLMLPGVGTTIGTALGATGATASGLGSAILGGAAGALTGGGLKGALTSAALSGLGNYAGAGGLGDAAGSTLAETTGNAALQGPTQGTGLVGAVTRNLPSGISNLGSSATNILGTGTTGATGGLGGLKNLIYTLPASMAMSEAQDEQLKAQRQAMEMYSPYLQSGTEANKALQERLASGFNPGDLTSDAGYQFQLAEGQKAIDAANAARGNYYSGAALKAAQEYGTGLANQTYQDAYNRWLTENQQLANAAGTGYNAAGATSGLYGTEGDIKANNTVSQANLLNSALADIFGTKYRKVDEFGNPIA